MQTHSHLGQCTKPAKVGNARTAIPATKGHPDLGAYGPRAPDGDAVLLPADALLSLRKDIIGSLSSALNGDSLAAEYCLLNAISRVVGRHDDTVLGAVPLVLGLPSTLATFKDQIRTSLVETLQAFMPRVVHIHADLNTLNNVHFRPIKDYQKNMLFPSPLQVGEGTALIIDETNMSEGSLSSEGLQSVQALSDVFQRQLLKAKFEYCDVAIHTDCPVISVACYNGLDGDARMPVSSRCLTMERLLKFLSI